MTSIDDSPASSPPPPSSPTWSIAIKTLGTIAARSPFSTVRAPAAGSNPVESTFYVQVDPEDALSSLGRKIESVTGLEPRRQRLIYRGRILTVEHCDDEDDDEDDSGERGLRVEGGASESTCDAAACGAAATRDDDDEAPVTRRNSSSDDSVVTRSDIMEYMSILQGRVDVTNDGEAAASTAAIQPHEAGKDANKLPGKLPRRRQRIRDIKGLSDGHTIHLVPRPAPPHDAGTNHTAAATATAAAANATTGDNVNSPVATPHAADASPFSALLGGIGPSTTATTDDGTTNITSISGTEGMNLLAALLGLSSNSAGDTDVGSTAMAGTASWLAGMEDNANNNTGISNAPRETESAISRLASLPSNRLLLRRGGGGSSSARARAAAARLTEADIRARDPGTVEPVRQGLMTLHTLLGNSLFVKGAQYSLTGSASSILDEGTTGEDDEEEKTGSLLGEDDRVILPFPPPRPIPSSYSIHQLRSNRQWYRGQWLDALDTVNQWLEATVVDIVLPSDILSTDSPYGIFDEITGTHPPRIKRKKIRRRTPDAVVSANDLDGRRRLLLEPRPENELQQFGLANRGGIDRGYRPRSDNEGVQLLLIHYNGWPHRWDEWIRSDSERIRPFRTRTRHRSSSQFASPTPQNVFQAAPATHIIDEDDEVERFSLLPELHRVLVSVSEIIAATIPRTIVPDDTSPFAPNTDAAHLPWRIPNHGLGIDSNSSSPSNYSSDAPSPPRRTSGPLDIGQLRRLAPIMDRLGRTLTDAAPHMACLADSLPPRHEVTTTSTYSSSPSQSTAAARVREMNAWASRIGGADPFDSTTTESQEDTLSALNDPDLTDYINGMVNTARGANRNERDPNRDPLISGLLSNYLSSQAGLGTGGSADTSNDGDNALGRLIRMGAGSNGGGRDAGGPGIDIHIHAVVTGPGMNTLGALGGPAVGGTTAATTTTTPLHSILRNGTPSSAANRAMGGTSRTVRNPVRNEDDMDLFSELYSESPTPVNMHGSAPTSENNDEAECHDLNPVFEECRSIEGESIASDDLEVTTSDMNMVAVVGDEASDTLPEDADDIEPESSAEVHPSQHNDEAIDNLHASPTATSLADAHDSNGSINTISEIESTDSTPSPTPRPRDNVSSPSFSSRLYRRTFGRLSGTNRRAGSNSP